MKRFIMKDDKRTISTKGIDTANKIVATKVPDSNGKFKIFFLIGNAGHKYYFSNLSGFALGGCYASAQSAIEARIKASDCCCNATEVYLFDDIYEALNELGE